MWILTLLCQKWNTGAQRLNNFPKGSFGIKSKLFIQVYQTCYLLALHPSAPPHPTPQPFPLRAMFQVPWPPGNRYHQGVGVGGPSCWQPVTGSLAAHTPHNFSLLQHRFTAPPLPSACFLSFPSKKKRSNKEKN